MIELKAVSKQYPTGQIALYNVNLLLQQGEMAFLTGHSGAGKSTLLRLIAMLETPSEGSIIVNHQDLSTISHRQSPAFRRKIGFIFRYNKN